MRRWNPRGIGAGFEQGRQLGRAEGRTEGKVEGRAEGLAEAIMRILGARGLPIGEDIRQRIVRCTEVKTLEHWLDRALTAPCAADVVADG